MYANENGKQMSIWEQENILQHKRITIKNGSELNFTWKDFPHYIREDFRDLLNPIFFFKKTEVFGTTQKEKAMHFYK